MEQKHISNPVQFNGKGGEFFGIWIVNVLLSIITLGIYSAWAKVRTKRYFYGNTLIAGDNFEYHATPMQILKGRLVAFAIVLLWSVSNSLWPMISALLLLIFYAALPWLLWSNARFDAVMTSYRNVHFSFTSSLKDAYISLMGRGLGALIVMMIYFSLIFSAFGVSTTISIILALGSLLLMAFLYAWVIAGVHKFFANGYKYGDWAFSADIKTGFFIKLYLKAMGIGLLAAMAILALMLVTTFGGLDFNAIQSGDFNSLPDDSQIGFVAFAYIGMIVMSIALTAYTAVCIRNYVFTQIRINHEESQDNEYQLDSDLTVKGYIWLVVSNFLLQVVTLGIARPWVMVRTSRYLADHTAVIGDMSYLHANDQTNDMKSAVTDEIAEAFDLGIGIG